MLASGKKVDRLSRYFQVDFMQLSGMIIWHYKKVMLAQCLTFL